MNSHVKWLRQAAEEIRSEGHFGWGNTCEDAADSFERLLAIVPLAQRVVDYRDDGTPEDLLELELALQTLQKGDK